MQKLLQYSTGISIILLIAVLFTTPVNGAKSWFELKLFTFQPSEVAKIFVILTLASLLCKIQEGGRNELNKPRKLLTCLAIVIVPTILIIMQPDYGTAMAFLVATFLMLFVAGLNKKYIIVTLIAIILLSPLVYKFILPDHAKSRIQVYLNPEIDARGSGYNIIQSKLAIGSGKLFGMGVLKGNQTQLGFLYPKTTDFIFSVISEEMGFIIAGSVHMIENIGMTMGLLPITGVPLPFVSYGGSSLLTNFALLAILMNISGRRQRSIFAE